jgi:acyl-CoA synthetase (AMP-forming)/AMP-acid ligase II
MTQATTPQGAVAAPVWGTEIEPAVIGGVPYRMYTDRPRNTADVLAYAKRWADRPHIVQGDRVVTFADLLRAVAAKTDALRTAGVAAGDRVIILGFNSPDWVINFWACLETGAVPVLANAWWSRDELADALATITPTLVLADTRAAARLPKGCATGPWEEIPSTTAEPQPPTAVDENDPAAVIFTSGTSGKPKAVVLSHRSLLGGLHMLLHITKRLPHQVRDTDGSAGLHTGPMFHIGGIQTLLRAVILGDTLVMPRGKFEPGEALELIETWKVTRWSAVPTMVNRVLEHPDVHVRDLRTLRSLTVGGAPVNADFLAHLRAGIPGVDPRVATGYGLTENGGQATAASARDTTERPGTCGRPLSCVELRIGPAEGHPDGEVLVRSPTQMLGFLGEGVSPIDAEGWLHTGDLGRIDDDGYLWITGRSKDMIIRGGENIAPAAVEEALGGLPDVVESAVFGVPHHDLGEEVMAVVYALDDATEDSLRSALTGRLASFAIPSRWQIERSPLPTGHSGKIDKAAIAAAARVRLAEEGSAS